MKTRVRMTVWKPNSSTISVKTGCDFVFGGDFNVSKSNKNGSNTATIVQDLCCLNGILWLDLANNDIDYTYYADTNGHYSHIDHMMVPLDPVHSQQSVYIRVDDCNASDHYAISTAVNFDLSNAININYWYTKNKIMKYMWSKGHAKMLSKELTNTAFPQSSVTCNRLCQHHCTHDWLILSWYCTTFDNRFQWVHSH